MVMEGETSSKNPLPDQTRVLDVKPLRTLVPVSPPNAQAPPFVCSSPFGPYPSGFSPFYPFAAEQDVLSNPTPIRSYHAQPENGDTVERGSKSYSSQRRNKRNRDYDSVVHGCRFVLGISHSQREDGDRETVFSVLMRFDAVRRRLSLLDDSSESPSSGIIKRPDLKAGNVLMTKGVRTNMGKRIGAVPGLEVGDIFFFRFEMCLVGLHSQSIAGIDYMITKTDSDEEPLAVSIVSSSGYDDEAEDPDVVLYSGQGGNSKDKPAADQKLERGNLALERSLRRVNQVRVIRGINYSAGSTSKVYIYDGIYTIQESWLERAKSGCNIFKYKLLRVPGQPACFSVWKSIEKWKKDVSSRPGLILADITSGSESIPVSLVNEVDNEKGLAYFTYVPSLKYNKPSKLMGHSSVCLCSKACQPGDSNCNCIERNGGDFPYINDGILVSRKPMIYECGPSCPCIPKCKNLVSQTGIKYRFEVFKTRDRGWGLRSLDPVRSGTFVCVYAGEVLDRAMEQDDYVFDSTRVYNSFKWNCEPGVIDDDDEGSDIVEEYNIPSPLFITSRNGGNISRFMNHSCSPNVFWQPIMYQDSNESFLNIAFFAMRHIPPLTELTYDYGVSTKVHGRNRCLCGSPNCRGFFG